MIKQRWIKKAIDPKDRGKFSAAARRAGETTIAYAIDHQHAAGKTGKRARLAKTLIEMHKK